VERRDLDARPAERRIAAQDPLEMRVAAIAAEERAPEAKQRLLLRRRVVRSAGDDRPRRRQLVRRLREPQRELVPLVVERLDLARTLAGHGIDDTVAGI